MITIGKFAGSVSAVALAFGASAALAVPSVEVVGTNYVGVIGTITDTHRARHLHDLDHG